MEGDRHFSHDHSLISLIVDDNEVDETDNYHFCNICRLPTLSAPSYTCTYAVCDFFLHESCAHKIHKQLILPNHKDHTLNLKLGGPNFIYECDDCYLKMHPLDALAAAMDGVEIKTKHKSHPPHPLVAHCRQIFTRCDACGEGHAGFFFSCQQCNFWIHRYCTVLPTALKLLYNPWPFLLVYSVYFKSRYIECIVCEEPMLHTHNAIYLCPQTMEFFHVRCGLDKIQSKTSLKLIQLPDEELDTFPSLEIRSYSQADGEEPSDEDRKLAIENFHKHPLVLVGDEEEGRNYNHKLVLVLVCDICIQTITIPSRFYRCSQQTGSCSFLAHKVCADLLPILKFGIPTGYGRKLIKAQPFLYPDKWYFSSIFLCFFCCLPTNAPCYYLPEDDLGPFMVDPSCMAAPMIIKHNSHSQHILFRTSRRSPQASPITCCSRRSTLHDVYKCTTCHFYIHIRCALLPKRIHFREFDQHPLCLITTGSSSTGSDHDICEVCEEGIDCKYWFYHCEKCDYSFHVNCIPSLGYLSKVKFGGKYSMTCHSHPLTLTRMLTFGRNERCGYCNQTIRGLEDQAAFSCSQCDYWIHFSCARDSFTSSHNCTSLVFEEIDAQEWYDILEDKDEDEDED